MATLTMGQAAKETGVSKATLSKALKNGRLSYVAKTTAGYEIDPAELFRVFPPKPLASVEGERSETHREHLLLDDAQDRKSTRLNSSHVRISYAVFCLKKKKASTGM